MRKKPVPKKPSLLKRYGLVFAMGFALIGLILTIAIHAATPVNNAFEPESGTVMTPAQILPDVNASSGNYVSFKATTATQ